MPSTVKEVLTTANAAVPRISLQEAATLIEGGDVLVADVRDTPQVQSSGKVKGAVHVPWGMLEFRADPDSPSHDPAFKRDKPVILYCGPGGRGALSGKTLQDLGYTNVRNLGGFKDWAEAGGEIEKL
jgi:rhodanese-related sulfurtransferase